MEPGPRRMAGRSRPRSGRSRPRGAGRSGRRRRYGCRTTAPGGPCSSPSTRCASPAGPSPMAVSQDGSPGFGPFHSAKSRTSSLAYSSASTRSPDPQLLRVEPGQPAVGRPRGDPEEDRAVVGPVGVAALEQRRDEVDDLRRCARSRAAGRRASSCAGRRHRPGTARGSAPRARRCPMPRPPRPRMILSSMSVMFMTQRTRLARQRRWRTSRSANRNERKLPTWAGP